MTKYEWIAPSGVPVVSCKPYREDEWVKRGHLSYAYRSYQNILKVAFWREPRRDLRIRLYRAGVRDSIACRIAGHVYGHMTKVCYCGQKKPKGGGE